MAALVHRSLTNSQAVALPAQFATPWQPGLIGRIGDTARLWGRRIRERNELARLGDRELHDIGASSADVWRETNEWFWRTTGPF